MAKVRGVGRVAVAVGIAIAIALLARSLYPADLPASLKLRN